WSIIAAQLPGRTDNDIKNYWNTKLKKKLMGNFYINPPGHSNLSCGMPLAPEQRQHFIDPFSPTIPTLSVPSSSTSDFYELSPFNSSSSSSAATNLQSRETLVGPINMYGHEAASCSSSDGSSVDKDNHHPRFDHHQQVPNNNLQGFSPSHYGNEILGPGDQDMINYGSNSAPLDYYGSIEEIKQLISNTSSSLTTATTNHNNNDCNYSGFLFDVENRSSSPESVAANVPTRADEGVLYYY
ncbi:hypothetical protein CRG98_014425, partial [Punica granatum]